MTSLHTSYAQIKNKIKKSNANNNNTPARSSQNNPQFCTPSPTLSRSDHDGEENNSYTPNSPTPFSVRSNYNSPSSTNSISNSNSNFRPTTSPPNHQMIEDEIEILLTEIRTAGLRKGRENCLIDLSLEIRKSVRNYASKATTSHKTWVLFAEENLSNSSNLQRELAELKAAHQQTTNEQLRNLQKLYEVNDGLKLAADKLVNQLKAKDENTAELKAQHSNMLNEAEVEKKQHLERETSRIKNRLAKDFERKAARCVESVESEYRKKLRAALGEKEELEKKIAVSEEEVFSQTEQIVFLTKTNEGLKKEVVKQMREFNSTEDEHQRVMEGCMEESQRLLHDNNRLESEVEEIIETKDNEIENQRERRRTELNRVEARVKEVMAGKDTEMNALREKLEKAEKRNYEFEQIIKSLNEGFE